VGRFTEKQMLLATAGGAVLLTAAFGALIWLDYEAITLNEITDQNPSAADETDPENWGERRKIQEIKRQMETAQAEADLMAKREQDVIVYREIVHRDAQILPEFDDVNNLAKTINDFETQSGVRLKRIGDLSVNVGSEAIKTMPIKLQLEGTFDQFLKFLNLFESQDRIINTRTFSMQGGRPSGTGREKVAIHDINLDLVTYIYTPSAGISKPVEIQNYDRRKDDPVIQKLVRQQKQARVDKYQLKPRINRRDPLIDPRRAGGADPAAGDPADVEKQRQNVDKLKFEIEVLKADVGQEQIFIQERKYVALASLKPMIDEKCAKLDAEIVQAEPLITVSELREGFHDDVVVPFEQIKSQRKSVSSGPVVFSRQQAQDFLDGMKASMEVRQYEKVAKTLSEFQAIVKGQEIAEDAADVLEEMQSIAKEAQVMIEFLALKIKTSGLIIRTGGSMVLINNKARKAGDFVDAANRCRLKEIHPDHLLFELDGFEIEHALEKKQK
jgi:Tfp pilus assembly protein PilO